MELPGKLLEQIAFNTRPKIEERMLIVMNKGTDEERLYQPLQTNNKFFKIAVTFLTGFNSIFNVTDKNNNFYFMKSITDEDDFIQITIPPGAYEIESLKYEIKRIIIDEEILLKQIIHSQSNQISPQGSFIEISPQGPIISFMFDDSIRDLLGFHAITLYEEYDLSSNPVDILSFDNVFLETNIAQGMICKGKRSGIVHNWTMTVDPGY